VAEGESKGRKYPDRVFGYISMAGVERHPICKGETYEPAQNRTLAAFFNDKGSHWTCPVVVHNHRFAITVVKHFHIDLSVLVDNGLPNRGATNSLISMTVHVLSRQRAMTYT
jgi:hypothetical protein